MDLSFFAAFAADAYLSMLTDTVTVTRGVPTVTATATVRARVTEFQPHEMGGGITQGDRKGILLIADLTSAGFPLPLIKGDRMVMLGRMMVVQSADDLTRRINGQSIAIDVHLRGA